MTSHDLPHLLAELTAVRFQTERPPMTEPAPDLALIADTADLLERAGYAKPAAAVRALAARVAELELTVSAREAGLAEMAKLVEWQAAALDKGTAALRPAATVETPAPDQASPFDPPVEPCGTCGCSRREHRASTRSCAGDFWTCRCTAWTPAASPAADETAAA